MSEWIEWKGGDCPVPADATVEVKLREGSSGLVGDVRRLRWSHEDRLGDVVAYRVVGAAAIKPDPTENGGWIEWKGGDCPVAPGVLTRVKVRGGDIFERFAAGFRWDRRGSWRDIVAYRVVEAVTPKSDPTAELRATLDWAEKKLAFYRDSPADIADKELADDFERLVQHLRKRLYLAPKPGQIGWYNTRGEVFMRLGELAATARVADLIESGEIVRVGAMS